MIILLAFFLVVAIWAIMNWLLGVLFSLIAGFWIIKLILSFCANVIFGILSGKYLGRKLLYVHLKKVYKDKDLTDDQG